MSWRNESAPAPIAVGDIVHVAGRVSSLESTVSPTLLVQFPFITHSLYIDREHVMHHEPAPPALKVGDTVLSKDGNRGVIRYIDNDWAVVLETEKRKTIRYLCDLQRVS